MWFSFLLHVILGYCLRYLALTAVPHICVFMMHLNVHNTFLYYMFCITFTYYIFAVAGMTGKESGGIVRCNKNDARCFNSLGMVLVVCTCKRNWLCRALYLLVDTRVLRDYFRIGHTALSRMCNVSEQKFFFLIYTCTWKLEIILSTKIIQW